MLSKAKIAVSISHLQVSKKKKGFGYVLMVSIETIVGML